MGTRHLKINDLNSLTDKLSVEVFLAVSDFVCQAKTGALFSLQRIGYKQKLSVNTIYVRY